MGGTPYCLVKGIRFQASWVNDGVRVWRIPDVSMGPAFQRDVVQIGGGDIKVWGCETGVS